MQEQDQELAAKIAIVDIGDPNIDMITLSKFIQSAKDNNKTSLEILVNGKITFTITHLEV